jgi:hypothetical protein
LQHLNAVERVLLFVACITKVVLLLLIWDLRVCGCDCGVHDGWDSTR